MSRKMKLRDYVILAVGLLCLACFVNTHRLYGQSMSRDEAYDWARKWLHGIGTPMKSTTGPDTLFLEGTKGQENIYLAGFDTSGFVVFSNDKNPILLAYSLDSHLPVNPDHPLFTEWLPAYSKQLAEAENQNHTTKKSTGPPDEPGMDEFVEPLIEAKWGQGIPWNKYCPADELNHHAPVGCVAVALAQIMDKWEWPVKGRGSNSYIPASHREYGTVEAVFDTTYYQWDQMHNTQPTDASALILFHAGVGTNMNYGPDESGANTSVYASNALINYFLYNPDMILREKESFTYDMWAQLLRQEMVNGRPVLYRGTDPNGGAGHAFNIDGFRDEYFFHFNWGWNGAGNGYYRLEAMVNGGGDYTKGQAALFGIQPNNNPQHDRPFAFEGMAGDGFVQLFWDEPLVNNLSHYNIYRNGELIESTWETRYRDDSLINGENYSYYLVAEYLGDQPGESLPTPSIDITPWERMSITYLQDFEDSLAGWQMGGTSTSFQWMRADSLGFNGNNSKVIGIRSDSAGPGIKVSDYLISPLLDIRGIENAGIKFDYLFRQVPHVDYLFLMYRRFDTGLWYSLHRIDSTNSWSDWQTFYAYFPDEAKNTLIQLGFFYTDNNGVGHGAAIDNVELFAIQAPPIPDFAFSNTENCQNQIITVTHQSTGPITHWFWDFGEGAEPRYSNEPGPHEISYQSGGFKTVKLVLNHLDYMIKENVLDIYWSSIANFTYEREGMLVSFNNLSEHTEAVYWDFGDGNSSTAISPVYQFRNKFIFDVELICFNPPCLPDTMRMQVDLRNGTGVENTGFIESLKIFPNPAVDYFDMAWTRQSQESLLVEFISVTGSVLRRWDDIYSDEFRVDLKAFKPGIYWVKITGEGTQAVKKIIVL